jgi:hypothetical protein
MIIVGNLILAETKTTTTTRSMGCCCCDTSDEPKKGRYDPSHRGPTKERHCTDVPCLLLLAAFLAAWAGISIFSFINGNPALLIYPSNSEGMRLVREENDE